MRTAPLLLLLALAGCARREPTLVPTRAGQEPASAPASVGRAWTIVPLKGTWKAHAVEITADGKVVVDSHEHARFVGNDLQDNAGKTLIHGTPEGEITVEHPKDSMLERTNASNRARFNERDEFITELGGHVSVGDDGTVTWMDEDGPVRAPLQIEGFTPARKREVLLLFLVLMRDY